MPADVTRMVLWLASDDSRMCTAQLWVVDAGGCRHLSLRGAKRSNLDESAHSAPDCFASLAMTVDAMTYDQFWLRYLRAHSRSHTRALHYIGSLLALASLLAGDRHARLALV